MVGGKVSEKELSQLRTDVHHLSDGPARVLTVACFKCRSTGPGPGCGGVHPEQTVGR